jgi:hypothetical protein
MLKLRKKLLRLYQHLCINYRIIKWVDGFLIFGDYQPAGAIKQLNAIRAMRCAATKKRKEERGY